MLFLDNNESGPIPHDSFEFPELPELPDSDDEPQASIPEESEVSSIEVIYTYIYCTYSLILWPHFLSSH